MQLSLLSVLLAAASCAVANPVAAPVTEDQLETRAILNPQWDGFPSADVTCPVQGTSAGDKFSVSYMHNDINESYPGPRANYPKKFGTKAPGAGNFHFKNNCLDRANKGETIWELPMLTGGVTWKNGPRTPGPYRVYFIVRDGPGRGEVTVTYCGSYAHTSNTDLQAFVECT